MAKSYRGDSLNVLFTCIGRRVSLLRSFMEAAKQLRIRARFLGTDITQLSPALQLCDKKCIVKSIAHPDYVKDLLQIVKKNKVKLLVPTIDTDLLLLAKNKDKFTRLGCQTLISNVGVIQICQDKRKTHQFLASNSIDAPAIMSVRAALKKKKLTWPLLLKPWDGAAGKGVTLATNRAELSVLSRRIPNCIAQQFIQGVEYTCDVYVDFDMTVRCVVPRKRIEVRAGEVSKGQVVKYPHIMAAAAQVVEKLGAGPGVITVQMFLTDEKQIKVVEINPRFGGGAPLAIKAGANFPKWILQELLGKKPIIRFDGFKDGLVMLRYDAEVWLDKT